MQLRTLAMRTLAAFAVILAALLGYDGVRGRSASVGKTTLVEFSGRSELDKPSASLPFEVAAPWIVDVRLDGDFDGVFLVKLRVPEGGLKQTEHMKLGDVAAGQERIYTPGSPNAFTQSFTGGGAYILLFDGKGAWTATVRY